MKKLSLILFLLCSIVGFGLFAAAPTKIKDAKITGAATFHGSPTPGVASIEMLAGSKLHLMPTSVISGTAIDWELSRTFSKTLSANTTFTFSNTLDDTRITVFLTNTASNYTVTWPAGIEWPGGTQPVQTVGAKTDEWKFHKFGSRTTGEVVQNFSIAVSTPTATATTTATPTSTATPTATATSTATATATATATPTATVSGPAGIAGLKLWLKADALGLSNNDPVSTWTDSSGTSNNATQGTGGLQPLFKTNIANGGTLPVVRFDGSDDRLVFGTDPGTTTTTFVVAALNVSPGSLVDYAAFVCTDNASGLRIVGKLPTTSNWGTFTTGDLSSGENLVSGTFNYLELTTTSGATVIYRNGTLKASDANHASGNGGSGNWIGCESGTNRFINADIAEVIIYDTVLSSGNRTTIEAYIAAKYGL